MEDIRRGKLIPVYYSSGEYEMEISGKEYADYIGHFANEANGRNGIVYPQFKNEPYNYFDEIHDAILSMGCWEAAEPGLFEFTGHTLQEVIQYMATKGFEMIE